MITKFIDGEAHTQDSIIRKYEDMVHFYSRKRRSYAASVGHDYEDLVSEGNIGLLKAFRVYDEKRGLKFATIAGHYIFGEIRKSYRGSRGDTGANYPRQAKELAYKIRTEELENRSIEEISEKTNAQKHHVFMALDYIRNKTPARFDAKIKDHDGGEVTLHELLPDKADPTLEEVEDFLKGLSDQEEFITRMLIEGKSQRVIGELLGISQIRVSRTKARIREKYLLYKDEVES